MRWMTGIVAALLAVAVAAPAQAAPGLTWQLHATGSDARLRGLSAVSPLVAWASGSGGTVLRTTDGGRTWAQMAPQGTQSLDFRDIEAFDAQHAVALSIGTGDSSRVYRTEDGGKSWRQTQTNNDPNAFYDCMAFFDQRHGLIVGDPVNGKFEVLATDDGGRSWQVLPSDGMPAAQPGEAGFAASGQCVATSGSRDAWIGSGGGAQSRIYHSTDRGRTWHETTTPLPSSQSSGVFAVAFRDREHGVAVGGDYSAPTTGAAATSQNQGRTWQPAAITGYRSGAAWLGAAVIAVGPTGSDLSVDGGRHWRPFDSGSFDTVDCPNTCWAAGEHGQIATLSID
ncbi:WD40/YVTN/BNR-like repeat-containing protein [Kutzneria sp. CA-103260]|uniref:WD40/YVTN/BNR-like repeat-containing protein n=1 Tax=Kutzneria sp. CA-103260 TaxID=2802641 RepID=UPI001BAE1846|nr:oxidoreductase [Kutzneria sp. CA-103260]QUQ66157.1 oxidoreductase [Kutzneria sp. CA-103260]